MWTKICRCTSSHDSKSNKNITTYRAIMGWFHDGCNAKTTCNCSLGPVTSLGRVPQESPKSPPQLLVMSTASSPFFAGCETHQSSDQHRRVLLPALEAVALPVFGERAHLYLLPLLCLPYHAGLLRIAGEVFLALWVDRVHNPCAFSHLLLPSDVLAVHHTILTFSCPSLRFKQCYADP